MSACPTGCLPCALSDLSFPCGHVRSACTQLPLGVLVGEDCALLERIRSAPKRRCELFGRLQRVPPRTLCVALVPREIARSRGSFAAHSRLLTSLSLRCSDLSLPLIIELPPRGPSLELISALLAVVRGSLALIRDPVTLIRNPVALIRDPLTPIRHLLSLVG